jgi:hypothetical protein
MTVRSKQRFAFCEMRSEPLEAFELERWIDSTPQIETVREPNCWHCCLYI